MGSRDCGAPPTDTEPAVLALLMPKMNAEGESLWLNCAFWRKNAVMRYTQHLLPVMSSYSLSLGYQLVVASAAPIWARDLITLCSYSETNILILILSLSEHFKGILRQIKWFRTLTSVPQCGALPTVSVLGVDTQSQTLETVSQSC